MTIKSLTIKQISYSKKKLFYNQSNRKTKFTFTMGSNTSKVIAGQFEFLEKGSKELEQKIANLQTGIANVSNDCYLRDETEKRLNMIQENYTTNNGKLSELIEVTKGQQVVIQELSQKYKSLFDSLHQQQRQLSDIAGDYENKFNHCEESLLEARTQLLQVENEVIANSEYVKVLGIRKTENMIKKQKMSPVKKLSSVKISPRKTRNAAREKLQNARDKKKLEKEMALNFTQSDESTKHESPIRASQNNSSNFLDIILNERRLSDLSISKDAAAIEVDISDI